MVLTSKIPALIFYQLVLRFILTLKKVNNIFDFSHYDDKFTRMNPMILKWLNLYWACISFKKFVIILSRLLIKILIEVESGDRGSLSKLVESVKTNYNERSEEIRKHWGGGRYSLISTIQNHLFSSPLQVERGSIISVYSYSIPFIYIRCTHVYVVCTLVYSIKV